MIQLTDVSKRYGPKVAVRDLNLTVPAGELFAFLGPNGAGKTTTIKMLCGLLFPTTGTVTVGGYDLSTRGDEARRLISYVPDQPFLYEKLTGREFLQFTCDLYGMDPNHARDRMAVVIEQFHLIDFVDDLIEDGVLGRSNAYKQVLLHRIDGSGSALDDASASSRLRAQWPFFLHLRDAGRDAAKAWLAENYDAVGRESTLDLKAMYT